MKWWWKDIRDNYHRVVSRSLPTESGNELAKEMDILDPILAEEPGDAACIVEVIPHTEARIKASFQSMPNATQRCLRSNHILPKASMIIASAWIKFMPIPARRVQSNWTGLWGIARPSHWTPWDHIWGPRNDKLWGGQSWSQSGLDGSLLGSHHDIHRQCLHSNSQPQEAENYGGYQQEFSSIYNGHFTAHVPMLFRPEFMKNVTELWDQVKALRRMREKPSPLGFQKAHFHPGRKKLVTVRRSSYNKAAHPGPKAQKSQLTGIRPTVLCRSSRYIPFNP